MSEVPRLENVYKTSGDMNKRKTTGGPRLEVFAHVYMCGGHRTPSVPKGIVSLHFVYIKNKVNIHEEKPKAKNNEKYHFPRIRFVNNHVTSETTGQKIWRFTFCKRKKEIKE